MPRSHPHFPELDLDISLSPEERDIIERAEELIHDLSFLDVSKPENVLDWLYQFSFTTKSMRTRRGYNHILQVFESKGIPKLQSITEADIHNKNQFALYLISVAMTAMREYKAIPNSIETLILYWKKEHVDKADFEILEYREGEDTGEFLLRGIRLSETLKKDVYIKFNSVIYFREFQSNTYHSEAEELVYIAGVLKSRIQMLIPDETISLSSIKGVNLQKPEDVLDYFLKGVLPYTLQQILPQDWRMYFLRLFQSKGYNIRQDIQTPPQVENESEYARYIIEVCLYEIYYFGMIKNQNGWILENINRWKHLYGTKEIWSQKKVFENGQKRIPKVLRQTSDDVGEVLEKTGEKGRLGGLLDFLRRK